MRIFREVLPRGVAVFATVLAVSTTASPGAVAHQHPRKTSYVITLKIMNHTGVDLELVKKVVCNPNDPDSRVQGHYTLWYPPGGVRAGKERTVRAVRKGWEGIGSYLLFRERGSEQNRVHVASVIRDNAKGFVLQSETTVWQDGPFYSEVKQGSGSSEYEDLFFTRHPSKTLQATVEILHA